MARLSPLWLPLGCVLLASLLWWKLPHPMLLPALGLALPALLLALRSPMWMVLGFIVFSFFRLHEVFPFLYPLRIPQLLAMAAIAALLWHIFWTGRLTPWWSPQLTWLTLFFLHTTLGALLAANRGEAMASWSGSYVKIYLMTLACAWLLRTPREFSLVVRVITLSAALVALVALYNKSAGIGLVEGTRVTIGRELGSVLGDPNDLSLVLLFGAGFSLSLLLSDADGKGWRLIGALGVVLVSGAIIATQSRGGLLGLCAVSALFAWHRVRSKALLITLGVLALMALFVLAGISGRASGGAAESGVDASAMGRLYAWQAAWGMALDHPFRGVGLSNFYYNYFFYSPHWDGLNHAVHSTWFGVLAETGFIGIALFVTMVGTTLKGAWRARGEAARADPAIRQALEGVTASLCGFIISGSFLTQGFTWPVYIELAITVALLHYLHHPNKEQPHG